MNKRVFGFDKPEASPGFLLWQTTITWQRLIKKSLDAYDISHAQFVILAITLWFELKQQEVTQILIIQQSKLDKMTVSKSVTKLVELGYLKRTENKQDARAKSISLTSKGKILIEKLVPIVEETDEKFFATIKKMEQRTLISIFNTLTQT